MIIRHKIWIRCCHLMSSKFFEFPARIGYDIQIFSPHFCWRLVGQMNGKVVSEVILWVTAAICIGKFLGFKRMSSVKDNARLTEWRFPWKFLTKNQTVRVARPRICIIHVPHFPNCGTLAYINLSWFFPCCTAEFLRKKHRPRVVKM